MLSYPTAELQAGCRRDCARRSTREALRAGGGTRVSSIDLLDEIATGDLYDLQERYVLLFDRTRSLSLHLFEHVHGESRDRGQAMVDLQALYEKHGLAIGRERAAGFPAAVPRIPLDAARRRRRCELLGQPAHILAAIGERLRKRNSPYAAVFRALTALSPAKPQGDEVVAPCWRCPIRIRNDLAALDAAWEDEPVTFGPGAGDSCKDDADGSCPRRIASGAGYAGAQRPSTTPAPRRGDAHARHLITSRSCSAGIPISA